MSDTPLTDSVAVMEPQAEKINGRFVFMGQAHEVVSAEFARTLEKQLAERDAALARCVEALEEVTREVGHMRGTREGVELLNLLEARAAEYRAKVGRKE